VADTVRGGWPELGFAPPVVKDKPLKGGKTYGISDAFVAFADDIPDSQFAVASQFTRLLAHVYLLLPKPPTTYHDYPSIAEKVLAGLDDHKGCWSHHHGFDYLNAYVCDYKTPPEIMVQLAVLIPVLEYADWAGRRPALAAKLEAGLPAFYDADLGTVRRWLPAATGQLDGSEEHKKELVMDSWYLHHPLLNLSRMALRGDEMAKRLFLQSLDYAIEVGRHFKYQWPIFYKMDTLEVIKAEAAPGDGGEKDVPGIYAHVMLQAWELTGKRMYFEEAERAVKTMASEGFDLFYQANNTAFSADAMLRMWKETGHEKYLDMSYLLMANIFKNVALWDCCYGYGKNFPLFFAIFPLNDAPYTAVYEEVEVLAAVHEYLSLADTAPLPRSYALLLAEFVRYAVGRLPHYYPALLPPEMVAEAVKTGEIDRQLWVPLEDINDGWEKSGAVGQEVYGAGFPLAVIPRHYFAIAGGGYLLFIDYPITDYSKEDRQLRFKVLGDERLSCLLCVFKTREGDQPTIEVAGQRQGIITPQTVEADRKGFNVSGDQYITVKWRKTNNS